jgi:putative ABC transport system permease protein
MLGVVIGVAAVIAAVGFAEGSMASITDRVEGMGSNMVTVMILSNSESKKVTLDDLNELNDSTQYIVSIAPYLTAKATIKAGTESKDTNLLGTTKEYVDIEGTEPSEGRFLTDSDVEKLDKVAVIGQAIKKKLFEGQDAVGQTIKINGRKFTIVGVMESVANGEEGTNDDWIIIPITVAQRTLKITKVKAFFAGASSKETVDLAIQKVKDFLYDIYKDSDAYMVFSQEAMLSILGDLSSIMTFVLGSIATISLVVGGIGIMNIMFVSVSERTREIGIRKAIGAKRRDIMIQFLIESLILTGIGGLIGIAFGLLIIKYVIGALGIIKAVYSVPWVIASFTISLIIGVTFGLFPANKAAKLNPIDALRSE